MMVSAAEQELYRVRAEIAADGFAADMQDAAERYTQQMFSASENGGEVSVPAPDVAWRDYVYLPESRADAHATWLSDWSFDVRPHLAEVHAPLLAVYGANDRSTPVAASITALQTRLPRANCLHVVRIAGTDHSLLRSTSGGRREIPVSSGLAPGAFVEIADWLVRQECDRR